MNLEEKRLFAPGDLSIQTDRLRLRKLNRGDAAGLFAYRSLPEIYTYQGRTATISDAAAFISGTADIVDLTGTWYQLGIFLTEDSALMGDIGIHFISAEQGETELGFTLAPAFQGQGYATEAVSAVINYLFKDLGKRRIIISVDPRNTRSRKMAARLGMTQMGCHDEKTPGSRDVCHEITYALNEEDWTFSKISSEGASNNSTTG